MAWLPVDQSLGQHRKTRQLARVLGVERPTAIGYLILLWAWALDNAPSGILTGIPAEDLADAAARNGDPQTFLNALVDSHFVDKKERGKGRQPTLRIHDWEQYGGKLCEARATHRDRMRRSRELIRVEESREEKRRVEKSREEPPPYPSPAASGGLEPDFTIEADENIRVVPPQK